MSGVNLTVRKLFKAYGPLTVFEDFSHCFPGGQITVIRGRSGRGKTTLLRLIAGLERPDAGEIRGVPENGVAMVFQEDRLPEQLTAPACLRCVLRRTPHREARIAEALAALSLEGDSDRPVRQFSGGMRRRVALARALLHPSELVLLDEPFKGLDEATLRQVLD